MIYLNNAATSYPKPQPVISAVTEALRDMPASSLRSSFTSQENPLHGVKKQLGRLLHIATPEHIILTSGATDAVNRIIGGLSPERIVATTDNHNSVLRPIHNQRKRCDITHVQADSLHEALSTMTAPTQADTCQLLVLPHCSNVTGKIHDVASICRLAHEKGFLVMVDASQSAGCIPIDVDGWGVDLLVFTGHKSLYGPQGTGGYYAADPHSLRPITFGGTGRDSSIILYEEGDWEYEPGTPNLPGMAGLRAGVEYVLDRGIDEIFRQEQQQANWLIEQLNALPRVRVYSQGGADQGPVVSFTINGLSPSDAGYILLNSYGIILRTGLHCSPLIHRELGTGTSGTIRASLSCHTTYDELHALVSALQEICESL